MTQDSGPGIRDPGLRSGVGGGRCQAVNRERVGGVRQ